MVQRKNVDEKPVIHLLEPDDGADGARIRVADTGVRTCEFFVGERRLQEKRVLEFLLQRVQLVKIVARHGDVNIVVPRDKTLVANGAEKRAAHQEIFQAVFFAYTVEFDQDVEFNGPYLFAGGIHKKIAYRFFLQKRGGNDSFRDNSFGFSHVLKFFVVNQGFAN